MPWDLDSDRPIFLQIVEQIEKDIMSGKYQPGERMPSVRDLAMEAAVNPNTMQKAMTELERLGLVYSIRTSGRFITEDKELIANLKKNLAEDEVRSFMEKMEAFGLSKDEVIKQIKNM